MPKTPHTLWILTAALILLLGRDVLAQTVHAAIIIPSDRAARADYLNGVDLAIRDLQAWYQRELGEQRTFVIDPMGVQVLHSTHPAVWFATNPNSAHPFNRFFANAVADAEALLGRKIGFGNTTDVWAVYVDADPACGQCGGCGGGGIVVIAKNDLRGLVGEPFVPACPGDFDPARTACRWIGGLGHELGHAMGLPHPPGCDAGAASCDYNALMWNGFRNYGMTYLRREEKQTLRASSYISVQPPFDAVAPCHGSIPTVPAAPGNLLVTVTGASVVLRWNASASAQSYIVEAGTASGRTDLFNGDVGNTTTLSTVPPGGLYFVRVRAKGAGGTSGPSNEVSFTVGGAACAGPPAAPTGFTFSKTGLQVTLAWNAVAGASSFVLEAGSASGLANLFNGNVGSATGMTTGAPPGTYFVRVRAVNPCGVGAASSEVIISLP